MGIDICTQRARQFEASDFDEYDQIYAMATDIIDEMKWIAGQRFDATKVKLFMDELYPGQQVEVPDPWYGPEPGYHNVYKLIDEACERMITNHAAGKT